MAMNFDYNQVLEHVDLNGMIAASMDDGVLDGLEVTEDSPVGMDVDVSIGSCYIGGVKYTESGITNVVISSAHSTYARKDVVVYDASAETPVVVVGIPAAIPEPPDIPEGDIILALIDVPPAISSISNNDITDKRIIVNRAVEYVELDNMVRAVGRDVVINGLVTSEKGSPDMSVDVALGECFIDETLYTESGITNVPVTPSDSTYARKDIIIYDKSGSTPAVVDGVASAHPVPVDIPIDDILLAIVDVPPNASTIVNANITDKRILNAVINDVGYMTHGFYAGDGTNSKTIVHGLGRTPVLVRISKDGGGEFREILRSGYINFTDSGSDSQYAITTWTSTNFYVGCSIHDDECCNASGIYYGWVAFG